MRKFFLVLGALALAASIGFFLGRRSPQAAAGTAWAQRFVKSPAAVGRVELEGTVLEGVVGVHGVEEACEVREQKVVDPDGNERILRLPGTFTSKNISFSLVMNKSSPILMHKWFEQTHFGRELERKNGSIIIFDQETGKELRRYDFFEAWPCKWHAPEVSEDTGGMAIEKVELAVEKIERG